MRVKLVGLLAVLATMFVTTTALGAGVPAPSSFTLSAPGTVRQGVTIKPVMKKRRDIGLVVFKGPKRTEVGTVVLGTFSAGRPTIHWNLKVHGKLLGSGSYLISLQVFANGKPTNTLAPPPRKLTIAGQHVRTS
jgi:hypothetical protein